MDDDRASAPETSWHSNRSHRSAYSHRSWFSLGSAWSVGSVASALSIGSAGSLLSMGSSGSVLSIGSAGSVLSIGSAGGVGVHGAPQPPDGGVRLGKVMAQAALLAVGVQAIATISRPDGGQRQR
jgi:hypothetical protein